MTDKKQMNVLLPAKLDRQIRVVAEVDEEKISATVEKALHEYINARRDDEEWRARYQAWTEEQRAKLQVF